MRTLVIMLMVAVGTLPLWGNEALAVAHQLGEIVHRSYMQVILSNSFIGCF